MKKTISSLIISIVSILSISATQALAQAKATSLSCTNTAHSKVTFDIRLTAKNGHLSFGPQSDGGAMENDLANQTLELTESSEDSGNGYIQYNGTIRSLEGGTAFREIQVRVKSTELGKSKNILLTMSPSVVSYDEMEPTGYGSYSMICQPQ